MSRYAKMKEITMARRKSRQPSLNDIEMALDEILAENNSMMPFDIQREGNFVFVLALAPKHNFLIRENKNKPFIVKRIHDFEKENNFFEETKQLKTLNEIVAMFHEYLAKINDYLERNK